MDTLASSYKWVVENTFEPIQDFVSSWKKTRPVQITVVTGDKRGAGTDANVYIVIYDVNGSPSKTIKVSHTFRDDHERGEKTVISLGPSYVGTPPFTGIDVWRDNFGRISLGSHLNSLFFGRDNRSSADWYLDYIEIQHLGESLVYPVHRWISKDIKYNFLPYDCLLPQNDPRICFRSQELKTKKKIYVLDAKIEGGPVQVESLPSDENFSFKFIWTFGKKKLALMASTQYNKWSVTSWKSFDEFKRIYQCGLKLPQSASYWKTDRWFGYQRVQGADPTHIRLCDHIPDKFSVEEEAIVQITGENLQSLLLDKRLFICDLTILEGLQCQNNKEIASPIALFYLNQAEELLPLAIQLRHKEDLIFTPLDFPNTWLVAKMFYNNAEAQYHQALTHLGLTHLLMEGVCATVHRCLSPSHPLFRLMAPHFLYLIAINKRGEEKLINPGGWVDSTMTQAVNGMTQLIQRGFQVWNFEKLNPELELSERRVLNPDILPNYPYRDDLLRVFSIIQGYVKKIVNHYYENELAVQRDFELYEWRKELSAKPPFGLGLKKVPGHDDLGFLNIEEIIETVTCIIANCSLGHSAANTQQYDQYGFIPNYPGILSKDPPKIKEQYTDHEVLQLLPSRDIILDIMVISELLSSPITNKLGDFEVHYLFHPEDVEAVHWFRNELKAAADEISLKNQNRNIPYFDLCPSDVPNSISI